MQNIQETNHAQTHNKPSKTSFNSNKNPPSLLYLHRSLESCCSSPVARSCSKWRRSRETSPGGGCVSWQRKRKERSPREKVAEVKRLSDKFIFIPKTWHKVVEKKTTTFQGPVSNIGGNSGGLHFCIKREGSSSVAANASKGACGSLSLVFFSNKSQTNHGSKGGNVDFTPPRIPRAPVSAIKNTKKCQCVFVNKYINCVCIKIVFSSTGNKKHR